MKRTTALAAMMLVSSLAAAHNCPNEMAAIDEVLPRAKLDARKSAEVKKLRAEGEQLHKAGRHAESMAALGRAKGMLGIK